MGSSRRELATQDDLTELLRDLSPVESCMYRGVAFDTYHREFKWYLPLLFGVAGSVMAHESEPGDYVKVRLPAPLGIDVELRALSETQPDRTGLDAYFSILATDVDFVRRFLAGPLAVALVELAKAYNHVEMCAYLREGRDGYIEFGPLNRRPEEIAADLSELIETLLAFEQPFVPCELVADNPFKD